MAVADVGMLVFERYRRMQKRALQGSLRARVINIFHDVSVELSSNRPSRSRQPPVVAVNGVRVVDDVCRENSPDLPCHRNFRWGWLSNSISCLLPAWFGEGALDPALPEI